MKSININKKVEEQLKKYSTVPQTFEKIKKLISYQKIISSITQTCQEFIKKKRDSLTKDFTKEDTGILSEKKFIGESLKLVINEIGNFFFIKKYG
jgi:hypothetical protein